MKKKRDEALNPPVVKADSSSDDSTDSDDDVSIVSDKSDDEACGPCVLDLDDSESADEKEPAPMDNNIVKRPLNDGTEKKPQCGICAEPQDYERWKNGRWFREDVVCKPCKRTWKYNADLDVYFKATTTDDTTADESKSNNPDSIHYKKRQ